MEAFHNITDDNRDSDADRLIQSCFDLKHPKSFFLFAGAGSGKTRSLVSALEYINKTIGRELKLNNRKVAVITYTKAARDEIKRRSRYNSLFEISTIHSFAWNLICSHTSNIRLWLKNEINSKIIDAEIKLATSRNKTTKTYKDTEKKLIKLKRRLEYLDSVKHFIYNPDGINVENNSLDHAEVIKISAELLLQQETLQRILVDTYPILLIDESQDTKKDLMNVFLKIQEKYSHCFSIGLLGDVMQRIYFEGKDDLHTSIPDSWETPYKIMNHRSRKRIVDLCNLIRKPVDGIEQQPRANKAGGFVRMFIAPRGNPHNIEQTVCSLMSKITDDAKWETDKEVKRLTIEHKMAAERLGFKNFFESLDNVSSYKQGLREGTLSVIGIFTHILLPLHKADLEDNLFEKAKIVKENALIYKDKNSVITKESLSKLRTSVDNLSLCWQNKDPLCKELLQVIYENDIFPLSKDLQQLIDNPPSEGEEDYQKLSSLSTALESPFSEVERYWEYINGNASFDTHQGVKGLEFERVMVIIDDKSSQSTMFNYGKLFGIEPKSSTDLRNESEGKETTLDRTRRLLYVTCSRAIDSLAIVFYTDNVDITAAALSATEWFDESEVVVVGFEKLTV
ncbi:MAG: UvrD-helicase domain-containing protein [Oscillospiraceae bacterium]